jgi:VRR-NUC domain.
MREADIERHLVARVKGLGGEVRKVRWIGRNGAPDRLVMLPYEKVIFNTAIWVELKNPRHHPKTFPADARERAQYREHQRMRAMGQRVEVIGTIEQVEDLLR